MSKTKNWAQRLNGRPYGNEVDKSDEVDAKNDGILIIYGYSDDNIEFRGLFTEEVGAFGGSVVKFTKTGTIFDEDDEEVLEKYDIKIDKILNTIEGSFGDDYAPDGRECSWHFVTDIPHEKFDVFEDEELFCIGIVIDADDLV